MNKLNYIVNEDVVSMRIDKFLASVNEELSRSYVQKLIDEKCILVNDQQIKANYKCKLNDIVSVKIPEVVAIEAIPQDIPLDIIYEDSDVIVVNKPKGMVVHPGSGNPDGTLVNALLFHCKDLSGINGQLRPGIVHRIDKDTTGLIVAAKNDIAHESLANQLFEKTATRKYYALVHGELPHEYGTIDAPIGRHHSDRQKMSVTSKNSKPAITHFKVIERFKDYTLIECSLETGRTHQIRVHLEYIGFPLVGDQKYSKRKTWQKTNGQMLHAFQLEFEHPTTHEHMIFNAELPAYFKDIINKLKTGGNVDEYK